MKCPLCDKEAGNGIVGHLAISHNMAPALMLAVAFTEIDKLKKRVEELEEGEDEKPD